MDVVATWLHAVGLGEHAAAFAQQRIQPDQLRALSDADLRELGLPIGDRIRLRRALALMDRFPAGTGPVERRPLTVTFIDLVDSTGLAARLEPEDLLDAMRQYRTACIDAVLRFGGHVAQFLGDGVVAYFCYPVAHDDDPERGVHAALEAVAAVARLRAPDGTSLAARAGVATGKVLMGDLFAATDDGPSQALGSTPNLAARLQALAPPGGVIVAADTAAKLHGRFPLQDHGARTLHGLADPLRLYRVLGASPWGGHRRRQPLANVDFVDREAEQARLHARWEEALAGSGGVALVRGEAGIGKSRLVQRFLATRAGRERSIVLSVQASPYHVDSPLQPVVALLRGLADAPEREPADALRRIRLLLRLNATGRQEPDGVAALADLLDLAGPREEALLAHVTPAQLKQLTMEVLAVGVGRVARRSPLVLVVEDAHWLDPTTLELLDKVIADASDSPLLVLLTARENFVPPDAGGWPRAEILDLEGLAPDQALRLFTAICGETASPELGRNVAERTGGVPLFIEECARVLAEAGDQASAAAEVPATIQECLAAQLDRASSAKAVAQAAAVWGQESLLAAQLAEILKMSDAAVTDALAKLEAAKVLQRRHEHRQEVWSFRHSLLREATYDSLLRGPRQELHDRICATLTPGGEPALIAHHLVEAGRPAESVPYFLAAARRSAARSALRETVRLLRRGLAALDGLPVAAQSLDQRLELLAILGPAVCSLEGYGSVEAQSLYEQAVELAAGGMPKEAHFAIRWGWWRVSRDFHIHRERAGALYADARSRRDRDLLLQAHHCNWASRLFQGDLHGCTAHVRAGLRIYDPERHVQHAMLYGNHDAKACAHGNLAQALWQRGRAAEALAEEGRSLAWARELGHLGSTVHALDLALTHRAYRRVPGEVRTVSGALRGLAEEHGFRDHRARCQILDGWAMSQGGDAFSGAPHAAEGLKVLRELSTAEDFPLFCCLVAEAWTAAGAADRALAELTAACREFETIGLRVWLAEVWRMVGELTLQTGHAAEMAAAEAFATAWRIADEQGAHRLALRAALAAARLAGCMGGLGEAMAVLQRERLAVADGEAGAADLREADALLARRLAPTGSPR